MRTVIFLPPLSLLSGGLTVLYRLANTLHASGRAVAVTSMHFSLPGIKEILNPDIPQVFWKDIVFSPDDIWLVPEGYPNVIPKGLESGALVVVYVQSWSYTLDILPPGVFWNNLPLLYLAVSQPVAWFLENVLRVQPLGVLPPTVNPCFFTAQAERKKHVRICYMPRKNSALLNQIRHVASYLISQDQKVAYEWVPIRNCSQEKVAKYFASSDIFLSAAFPEGFGLGPIEAMAQGCVPVTCPGFGGWDYMRALPNGSLNNTFAAHFTLPEPPFPLLPNEQPNCFMFPDGDILAGGALLAAAIGLAAKKDMVWTRLQKTAVQTALTYTENVQQEKVEAIWKKLSAR